MRTGNYARGEQNHNAKLTADDVSLIRTLHASGEVRSKEIAEKFDISVGYVSEIASYKRWKHVP